MFTFKSNRLREAEPNWSALNTFSAYRLHCRKLEIIIENNRDEYQKHKRNIIIQEYQPCWCYEEP